MQDESQATSDAPEVDRWDLIRDIAVLQVKLVVDGLRDLILVPVSLVVGIISVVKGGDKSNNDFYDLLRLGKKSERWINLFGAAERVHGDIDDDALPVEDIDEMVTRVEAFIVDEYKSGGVTRQAKVRLDQAIDVLHKSVRKTNTDADQ